MDSIKLCEVYITKDKRMLKLEFDKDRNPCAKCYFGPMGCYIKMKNSFHIMPMCEESYYFKLIYGI